MDTLFSESFAMDNDSEFADQIASHYKEYFCTESDYIEPDSKLVFCHLSLSVHAK